MEGIINLIQQMGKEGKAQWEAPGRMWFRQKEVVELPFRDTAVLCMATTWDLSKVTQEIIIIFPLNSNLLCANPSVFIAGCCFSSETEMSWSLHEGDKLRIPQWLSTEHCTCWHLKTGFPLNLFFMTRSNAMPTG